MSNINVRDMRFSLLGQVKRGGSNRGRCYDDVLVETRAQEIALKGPVMSHIGEPCGAGKVIAKDGFPRRDRKRKGLTRPRLVS
jgi:hypothetical protein